jgi:cytochrome c oxidase subunit 2
MRLHRTNILGLFAVGALAVATSACGGGETKDSASAPDTELSPAAAAGKTYFENSCGGCHSVDGARGSGPTFKGLGGSAVELQNGQTVTADTAYLVRSIVDPAAEVVKGYPNIMASAIPKGSVPEQDAQNIAAYIEALR